MELIELEVLDTLDPPSNMFNTILDYKRKMKKTVLIMNKCWMMMIRIFRRSWLLFNIGIDMFWNL